ncbi:MAG TPA: DUF2851 family protein [Bacteroidota bacterium]|nr:DUF2851 family protein [Bacteroidota bacterium]
MGKLTLNIPERFLRHIWNCQYLDPLALKTSDNRVVRVLEAGSLNSDGGPDFRDAVIRIGGTTYRGDVEFHKTLADWRLHRHSEDPGYNRVILHVVFERGSDSATTRSHSGRTIPVLLLEPFLSESIRLLWHKTIQDEHRMLRRTIRCAGFNSTVDATLVITWIRRLAVERLELKLRRLDERLRELAHIHLLEVHDHTGDIPPWRIQGDPDDLPPPFRELKTTHLAAREFWDQLLYEGLMECLGYSKNREPFLRLARAVTLRVIRDHELEKDELSLQAVLFGAGGLLPKMKDLHEKESREFVRDLTHRWREFKPHYRASVLHAADWQFFPTRPANFPTHRLAAATPLIRFILSADLFRGIVEKIKSDNPQGRSLHEVRSLFRLEPLQYWTRHTHFDRVCSRSVHPLGAERIDIAIANVVVPLVLLYARIFRDRVARERTLQLFESMPPAAENSITRFMAGQLVQDRLGKTSVSTQQGVIQLYKYYCSEERCAECDIGVTIAGALSDAP